MKDLPCLQQNQFPLAYLLTERTKLLGLDANHKLIYAICRGGLEIGGEYTLEVASCRPLLPNDHEEMRFECQFVVVSSYVR